MIISIAAGRFTVATPDAVMQPRIAKNKNPVVYCVGTGVNTTGAQVNAFGISYVTRHLVELGHSVFAPTAPNLWGNATGQARIDDALAYAASMGQTGPAILVGFSQGGIPALAWAMNNPADTAGVIGLLGAVDLNEIREDDDAGQRSAIDDAYGVTYPDPLPVGVNPADRADEFTSIPTQWWYSEEDLLIDAPTVEAFAATAGTDLHDVGTTGHDVAGLLNMDLAQVTAFVEQAIGG